MKQVAIALFEYNELSKASQAAVIQKHVINGWYDYSDHERSDYNQSLSGFNTVFDGIRYMGNATGETAKQLIVKAFNRAAEIQAKANHFYAESFAKKYNSKIETVEQAIDLCGNCVFTGVCTDFYLTDTFVKYLSGTDYQNLNINELIKMALKKGRAELNKQCRYYQTNEHIHNCLSEQCEDWFFEDGTKAPENLSKQAETA